LLLGSGVATSQPAASAEVDPFVAMDAILSEGTTSSNNFLGTTTTRPVTSSINTENESEAALKASSSPIMKSDIEAALQESKKRRKIDPRTHG